MTGERNAGRKVDTRLLELLACPLTKGPLKWDAEHGELVSRLARLAYPVRDGIPIMLPSEARALSDEAPDRPPPTRG
ncbi:MAG: Trm112 family protein [Mesorhizobium sp.]|nr:Trm112 family protein [Mesorhizobium sp.]MBN9241897.1 Trm112 family protein [Mesorhizobium sp.]MBN9269686.1 Trm112 family protein [Mesorhizobium sp.]